MSPLPVLGGLPETAPVVEEECGVRSVIVCFTDRMDADLVTVLRANAPLPADVYVVPRMYELATAIPAGSRDDVWGIPIIPLRPGGPRWPGQVAKRVVPEARQQAERWLWVPWGFRGPPGASTVLAAGHRSLLRRSARRLRRVREPPGGLQRGASSPASGWHGLVAPL